MERFENTHVPSQQRIVSCVQNSGAKRGRSKNAEGIIFHAFEVETVPLNKRGRMGGNKLLQRGVRFLSGEKRVKR